VVLDWEGFTQLVAVYDPLRQVPSGILGIKSNVLCYKGTTSVLSALSADYANTLTISLVNPERFVVGDAYLIGATTKQVEITAINATSVTIQTAVGAMSKAGCILQQTRLFGRLSGLTVTKTGTGNNLTATVASGKVLLFGPRSVASRVFKIGTGKYYIFAKLVGETVSLVCSAGPQKNVTIGGVIVAVDDIPAKSVLVGVINNGVVDPIDGAVLLYKCTDEIVGAVRDRTGRITVLCHNYAGKELRLTSDTGYTWEVVHFD